MSKVDKLNVLLPVKFLLGWLFRGVFTLSYLSSEYVMFILLFDLSSLTLVFDRVHNHLDTDDF